MKPRLLKKTKYETYQNHRFTRGTICIDLFTPKISRAWLDTERHDKRLEILFETLTELGVILEKVERKKLDKLADGMNHQGVVLEVSLPEELSENELKTAVEHLLEPALFWFWTMFKTHII